jgi:hypothetical protein
MPPAHRDQAVSPLKIEEFYGDNPHQPASSAQLVQSKGRFIEWLKAAVRSSTRQYEFNRIS